MRRKEQAKVEPRSCKETTGDHDQTKRNPKGDKKQEKGEGNSQNHTKTKQNKRNRGQASGKPLFDTVVESSDAESKVDQRLSGVPPWETQRECTNELIGSDLVEHEKLGKHP